MWIGLAAGHMDVASADLSIKFATAVEWGVPERLDIRVPGRSFA
jgi:hypothetical protein